MPQLNSNVLAPQLAAIPQASCAVIARSEASYLFSAVQAVPNVWHKVVLPHWVFQPASIARAVVWACWNDVHGRAAVLHVGAIAHNPQTGCLAGRCPAVLLDSPGCALALLSGRKLKTCLTGALQSAAIQVVCRPSEPTCVCRCGGTRSFPVHVSPALTQPTWSALLPGFPPRLRVQCLLESSGKAARHRA